MHRLLVEACMLEEARVVPERDAARHLRVLRPRPGEEIELFDGRGRTRVYRWDGAGLAAAAPVRRHERPATELTLFACVTKGSRWDWTIEKAVELGVTRVVPVISERCVVRLDARDREAKAERWRRIAEDAARQSDAVWLPDVLAAVDFPAALGLVGECGRVFVGALVDPPARPLLAAVVDGPPSPSLGLFVGPEGDFTPAELAALLEIAVPTSFGPTVLRAETAAVFGVSVLAAARAGAWRGAE